jgi:hypothetical protein
MLASSTFFGGTAPISMTGIPRVRQTLALVLLPCTACTATYRPETPHVGIAPGASVEARRILTVPPAAGGADQVVIQAEHGLRPSTALVSGKLSPMTSPPCEGGLEPLAWSQVKLGFPPPQGPVESLAVSFPRAAIDREGLLWAKPTALDFKVLHPDAPADCLRVPLVENLSPEWMDRPVFSFGMGFRIFAPFARIYGVDATTMFVVRFGSWLGPMRLRVELAGGGAWAHSSNANLTGYSFGAGLLADAVLFAAKSVGVGVAAGYDITGISFAANIDSFSHQGAGFAGFMHGPRAGLTIGAIPEPPPGPAFSARRGARSMTFEVFSAALWSQERAAATPALWFTLSMDAGLP